MGLHLPDVVISNDIVPPLDVLLYILVLLLGTVLTVDSVLATTGVDSVVLTQSDGARLDDDDDGSVASYGVVGRHVVSESIVGGSVVANNVAVGCVGSNCDVGCCVVSEVVNIVVGSEVASVVAGIIVVSSTTVDMASAPFGVDSIILDSAVVGAMGLKVCFYIYL